MLFFFCQNRRSFKHLPAQVPCSLNDRWIRGMKKDEHAEEAEGWHGKEGRSGSSKREGEKASLATVVCYSLPDYTVPMPE